MYNLNTASDIANFHSMVAGYANDNAAYTENGTAAELLEKYLNDANQMDGATEAEALQVSADQVADAKKAFLFAATGYELAE